MSDIIGDVMGRCPRDVLFQTIAQVRPGYDVDQHLALEELLNRIHDEIEGRKIEVLLSRINQKIADLEGAVLCRCSAKAQSRLVRLNAHTELRVGFDASKNIVRIIPSVKATDEERAEANALYRRACQEQATEIAQKKLEEEEAALKREPSW